MAVVSIAPSDLVRDHLGHWQAFRDSAVQAGLETREDPALGRPGVLAFEFCIDGVLCVYDFSEFVLVEGPWQDYRHWFKREFTAGHLPYLQMHPFSAELRFCDWEKLEHARRTEKYQPGERIAHKQTIIRVPDQWPYSDLYDRRTYARRLLLDAFGERVDTRVEATQAEFFRCLVDCLVSVHIPGISRAILDRGIKQAWALGVCTISPPLQTLCCDATPEPWEHYVPIRVDCADLIDRVYWCDTNREECVRIGQRAARLYASSIDPSAVWQYVRNIVRGSTGL